jgi:hypothetical protein
MKTLQNPLLTIILICLLGIILLFYFLIAKPVSSASAVEPLDNESFSSYNSDLLPPGYRYPELKTKTANTAKSASTLTSTVKPKKTTKPKSTPIPEKVQSTLEARDQDRMLITELLADKVSEYFFYYEKLPELYSNKSESLLDTEGSEVIYFYNQSENKTNAMALNLSIDSYSIKRVSNCSEKSLEGDVNITYSLEIGKLILCKESGESKEFYVQN